MSADEDATLLEKLQLQLKPKSGPAPALALISAAVAMARDPQLSRADACRDLPRGSHSRAAALRDLIDREELLTRADALPLPPPPTKRGRPASLSQEERESKLKANEQKQAEAAKQQRCAESAQQAAAIGAAHREWAQSPCIVAFFRSIGTCCVVEPNPVDEGRPSASVTAALRAALERARGLAGDLGRSELPAELPMRFEWDPPTTYHEQVRSRLIPGKIEEEFRRQPGMAFYYALVNNALKKTLSGPVATPAGHFWIESLYGSERMRTNRECFASRHSPDAAPPARSRLTVESFAPNI